MSIGCISSNYSVNATVTVEVQNHGLTAFETAVIMCFLVLKNLLNLLGKGFPKYAERIPKTSKAFSRGRETAFAPLVSQTGSSFKVSDYCCWIFGLNC